jgi:hypothetical protein
MLCKEIFVLFSEINIKHTNLLRGQNVLVLNVTTRFRRINIAFLTNIYTQLEM